MGANNAHLQELHPQSHQGVCADAIATLEGISREALDAHARGLQRKAEIAIKEGRFDRALIPVYNLDGSSRSIAKSSLGQEQPLNRWQALRQLPAVRTTATKRAQDLPRAHQPEVPETSISTTSIMPATRRASLTAPRRFSSRARIRIGPAA